jgi:DNA polymerase-1
MRMMAHVTRDKVLIEALRNGWDLHARTAIACYPEVAEFCRGKQLSKELLAEVKKHFPAQRQGAKTVNFMVAYGGGPMRYAEVMHTSMHEGKRVINAFFNTYSGLRAGIERVRAFARKHGYVRTILNRRIHVPDINSSNKALRGMAERQAFNYVAQGGAGEWIKMAMLLIDECPKLEKLDVKMYLQIHDELLTGQPKSSRKKAQPLLEDYMSNPHKHFGLEGLVIETPADFGFGNNWLEAKS